MQIFGYEEIVDFMPKRKMRAKALENTVCLYLN